MLNYISFYLYLTQLFYKSINLFYILPNNLIFRRKLFFKFSWDVNREKFFDYEKMKKSMQNEMTGMLVDFQTTHAAQRIQDDIMQELSDQYMNSRQVMAQTKRTLVNNIDSMNMLVIKPW